MSTGFSHLDQAEEAVNNATFDKNTSNNGEISNARENTLDQSREDQSSEKTAEEIMALEKLAKFKFKDQEWTPEQLEKAIMRHSDYTKKTQEVAEKRKYYDNLGADLDHVYKNPSLAEAFKKTYPKEFHQYLDLLNLSFLPKADGRQSQAEEKNIYDQLPEELRSRLDRVENYVREKEVLAAEQKLDSIYGKLQSKYPDAIEEVVTARAQALADQGIDLTESVFEKLFKKSQEDVLSRLEKKQQSTLQTQRSANQQAKGPGPGGGIPGQAPKKMTLNEATEAAIAALTKA